ncbi:MAG: hypothetical protein KKA79_05570 [Nanoarchaeota archaeon]|nr:hypothetical protein [Nanoarchaeota archaeon]MCG2718387.1 hypothetical protein [Nanoarchaeota archaeon]
MKKILIILIALFLISGCAQEQIIEKEECLPPRIISDGECCLDADSSGVCDIVEEALKRVEQIEEEEEAVITEEKIPDECIEMSSWVTCQDLEIMYDTILQRGLIKIQLGNNREGILVIKSFKFPSLPECNKELNWNIDTTGLNIDESAKYAIECDALEKKDLLDTEIQMGVNYYEKVKGLDPGLETQYLPQVEQIIKGRIKGST